MVVNNAGILRDRFFFNMSVEEWRAVIDVHLNGSFYVSRAAAPHFKNQNSGCYVHMTSTSGLVGNLGQANYSAAKLGIVGLSKSIALDMAKYKVRSNCISPFAWSRMIGSIPAETDEQRARVEKLKAMETGKIAPLAVYLASDNDVTGQIFAVRANEIFLMSQSRPLRSVHRAELDRRDHRRARDAGVPSALLSPRALAGRVLVGPALKRVLLTDAIAPAGEEALSRAVEVVRTRQRARHDPAPRGRLRRHPDPQQAAG